MSLKPFLPLLVLALSLLIGLALRKWLFKFLDSWLKRTKHIVADAMVHAAHAPSLLWAVLIALYIALKFTTLPARQVEIFHTGIAIVLIFSVALVVSAMARFSLAFYAKRIEDRLPIPSLAQNLSSLVILGIGVLMILNTLGISITPILTALGVGGLAVALALQDTLSNLFSGIYLILAKNIRPGDYIKLESGEEGYVLDISSRVTKIKTLPNNLVIIPNQKLSQAIVTNYHLPEKRMALLIPVSVSYQSDPERIERMLIEEAREAANQVPGLLGSPEPFVRFIPGFSESSLDFTLICQVNEFVDQYLAQHELRKRILKRFKREEIEIPYPQRVVSIKEGPGKS